jgi:hypothetical protein
MHRHGTKRDNPTSRDIDDDNVADDLFLNDTVPRVIAAPCSEEREREICEVFGLVVCDRIE